MCGILGLVVTKKSDMTSGQIEDVLAEVFELSETRGSESSGIAIRNEKTKTISVYKRPIRATKMIKTKDYKDFFYYSLAGPRDRDTKIDTDIVIIGHSRLVTNGSQEDNDNNQPAIKSGAVAVHNGIIVNVNDLWQKYGAELERKYEVDTEIFLDLLRLYLKQGKSNIEAVRKVFADIYGSASMAVLMEDSNKLLLVTNTGSLYYIFDPQINLFLFASEKYIAGQVAKKLSEGIKIQRIEPFTGMLVDLLDDLLIEEFGLRDECTVDSRLRGNDKNGNGNDKKEAVFEIKDFSPKIEKKTIPAISLQEESRLRALLEFKDVSYLKRCARCILPETMPFIELDENGVCNYCRNYKKIECLGEDRLSELAAKYRSKSDELDIIVPFSGGRDSSYGLHYVKTVLKMNPVAFSYDWGMITDLARRNQARLCGKLGIEHILISADIRKKRDNIKKNVLAWLNKPDLGTIPLFMAGDKQYFYYANKLAKRMDVELISMCENPLERTHFKHGFCGVGHSDSDKPPYFFSVLDKARLASYYLAQFAQNSGYLNSSLADTFAAFVSYYLIPHNYLYLYNYVKWEEEKISSTLIETYDWEVVTDTKSTWRIGDGTAAFYNYIYYTVAGFTENDTFRSNQIREGVIIREEALRLATEENRPRFESIRWYCDTINIDFEKTIKAINDIPKLYSRRKDVKR